jgi:hypothetical protein
MTIRAVFNSEKCTELLWLGHGTRRDYTLQLSAPVILAYNHSIKKYESIPLTTVSFKNLIESIDPTKLKKISKFRIAVCGVDGSMSFLNSQNNSFSTIDSFLKYLYDNDVVLESSKKQATLSNILDENVTILRKVWLSKSFV